MLIVVYKIKMFTLRHINDEYKKNLKIPKGQTEIVKPEDRQDCGQQKRNERQT